MRLLFRNLLLEGADISVRYLALFTTVYLFRRMRKEEETVLFVLALVVGPLPHGVNINSIAKNIRSNLSSLLTFFDILCMRPIRKKVLLANAPAYNRPSSTEFHSIRSDSICMCHDTLTHSYTHTNKPACWRWLYRTHTFTFTIRTYAKRKTSHQKKKKEILPNMRTGQRTALYSIS